MMEPNPHPIVLRLNHSAVQYPLSVSVLTRPRRENERSRGLSKARIWFTISKPFRLPSHKAGIPRRRTANTSLKRERIAQ